MCVPSGIKALMYFLIYCQRASSVCSNSVIKAAHARSYLYRILHLYIFPCCTSISFYKTSDEMEIRNNVEEAHTLPIEHVAGSRRYEEFHASMLAMTSSYPSINSVWRLSHLLLSGGFKLAGQKLLPGQYLCQDNQKQKVDLDVLTHIKMNHITPSTSHGYMSCVDEMDYKLEQLGLCSRYLLDIKIQNLIALKETIIFAFCRK